VNGGTNQSVACDVRLRPRMNTAIHWQPGNDRQYMSENGPVDAPDAERSLRRSRMAQTALRKGLYGQRRLYAAQSTAYQSYTTVLTA
jgi:hypothetical protein